MMAVLALIVMTAAALGWGALALRALGQREPQPAWAFGLGLGILGWLAFFPAILDHVEVPVLATVCMAGLTGLPLLRHGFPAPPRLDGWAWALLALLAGLALLDLAEALAPPADADSLAYHFAIPKQVLQEGRLPFLPRAVDGAVPLLVQMTYLLARGLGGEQGMTLWCMVSGWGAAGLVYTLCRRHLGVTPALAAAVLWQGIPLVTAAAGSGQIEVRLALFATIAAFAAGEAIRKTCLRSAVLAGLAAGFYAGSKYPGLIFALVVGLSLLGGRGRWRNALAFGLAAALTGGQWYVWNGINTGDPFFPMLFGKIPYLAGVPWNQLQHDFMNAAFFGSEKVLPQNPLWLAIYPFQATLQANDVFESGRTGLGLAPLMLLPFAMTGAWMARARLKTSELTIPVAIILASYGVWYLFGPSQRVRHLLPLMPVLLVGLTVAATRIPTLSRPLSAGIAVVLALQAAGAGLYGLNYLRHWATGESREDFLRRNVVAYDLAAWLNSHLPSGGKVVVQQRQLNYLLDVNFFYAHGYDQAELEIRPDNTDPALFWAQLRRIGATHVVARGQGGDPLSSLTEGLIQANCAAPFGQIAVRNFGSRTLSAGQYSETAFLVVQLTPETCPF